VFRERVIEFVTDLPKSPRDMAERLKKVPLWYKSASLITVASLAACQLGERFGFVTPPPESTQTPPTETIPPTDQASETKIFAGMLIGEAGIGMISGLTQEENPDPVFVSEIESRALEALRVEDANLDPERIKVYAFEMQGETGNAPFPLISVSDKDNPDKLLSVFAGFGVDANGVLVPPKGGKIAVLLRLTTVQSESESSLVYVGIQSREDPLAIYLPALFEVKQSADEIYFIPPYADSLGQSVPVRGGKYLFSPKPVESTPEGLNFLPAGIIAVRNTDGSWGVGIDEGSQTKAIPGILVDTVGFHLAFDGGQIDIATAEIAKRLKAGQDSPLQVYNEAETAILFGYDAENKVWVDAAKVLSPDKSNPENYIKIQTWDDVKELARKEKMVLLPFPPDTYFPPLDKVIIKYYTRQGIDPKSDFNFEHPFGILEDLSKSPFRFVNFILLEKGEGRKFDTYIVTEQVYNLADGTFSVLHFGFDEFEPGWGLGTMQNFINPSGNYLLPAYHDFSIAISGQAYCYTICNEIAFFKENNYFDITGGIPKVKSAVEAWLTTGVLSDELDGLSLISQTSPISFLP